MGQFAPLVLDPAAPKGPRAMATGDTLPPALMRRATVALVTSGATTTLDLAKGDYFTGTLANATTLALANVPAVGTAVELKLMLTNAGAFAITYPSAWTFRQPDGSYSTTPPSGHILSSGVTEFSVIIDDGGTAPRVVV